MPEEVRHGDHEEGWLFVVRWRQTAGAGRQQGAYITHGERLTAEDLAARIPDLAAMPGGGVSLAGLGAIGGPLAIELARGQVGQLRLLDFDAVEAGNIVRWPYGLGAVGNAKSDYLAAAIGQEYPFTTATPYRWQIGGAPLDLPPGEPSEAALITGFLEGSDLLIDATAEIGVSALLATLARAAGIPLLTVWATEGGWGGAVAHIPPDGGGCWYCLQHALGDGSLRLPPASPAASVQPRGCGAPTFTGSSFQMLEIIAQAMRTTARSLAGTDTRATLHVCATRGEDGAELDTPVWRTQPIPIHRDCHCCAFAAAA